MYIIAFNFFSVGFLAAIIYINLGRLTTESLDLIIWVLSPILRLKPDDFIFILQDQSCMMKSHIQYAGIA